ncbi:MAG: high light inducible protein [Acaryochloridaceae cyanobacterium CSU_3_4]|nr:high light inducible protein [Acaryochloridaceae cyanobacterium CSU_3_4]
MSTQNSIWGFTDFAETFGGRLAMVGFFLALVTEILTGQGIVGQVATLLHF